MTDLSGDWNSYYRYPSTGRGEDFWEQHLLHVTQTGSKIKFETGPESASYMMAELELGDDGKSAHGTWSDDKDPNGYYKGVHFEGTVELQVAESGERLSGVWHGPGRDGIMHSDIWELAKVKTLVKADMPKRWRFTHWYPGDNDEGEASDSHIMRAYWDGATLVLESLPENDGSYMLARLLIQDDIAAGSWYENAQLSGPNQGAQYSGAGQLMIDAKTHRMEGLWAGAGYDHALGKMRIYTGRWEIVPIDDADV
ncbi:MAG TPA: hypothetical protein VMB52_00570 [Verrucomicrobiae bacterium]|nr:hypothetical protein [Verrucomicrobiae bacterium]